MLIGTFCRSSTRFCEVTVIASSVLASFGVVAVSGVGGDAAGVSCAHARGENARQTAAASGNFLSR